MAAGSVPSDTDLTGYDIPHHEFRGFPCPHRKWDYDPEWIAGRECRMCGHRELLYGAPYRMTKPDMVLVTPRTLKGEGFAC